MLYVTGRHLVTIHLASESSAAEEKALCGARPKYSEWYGQDVWTYSQEKPMIDPLYTFDEVLCKRCRKSAKV